MMIHPVYTSITKLTMLCRLCRYQLSKNDKKIINVQNNNISNNVSLSLCGEINAIFLSSTVWELSVVVFFG